MKRELAVVIGFLVVSAVLLRLWHSPIPVLDVLVHPIFSLWETQGQLETSVSDVVTHLDPVAAATRRLMQPFGAVRLTRRFVVPSIASETKKNN